MSNTDVGGMGYGPAGAQCALHPDQPAARTCARCGSFMCSTCAEGGAQTLCPSCQQRLGLEQAFPLTRENWSFSALWDYCFEIFKREWLNLGLAALIFFGISMIAQLVGSILPAIGGMLNNQVLSGILTVASMFIQQAVQGMLGLGLMRMMFDLLQGRKAELGQLFSQVHKLGTFLITMLLIILMVALPMGVIGGLVYAAATDVLPKVLLPVVAIVAVLAIIPLIYFMLPLYLLQAEIAYSDETSPMQLLRNCYAYARGERLSILGVGLVGGLVSMAGVLACCIGLLPAMGLSYLLMAGLYLALRSSPSTES
jgi:hypothetical protein